MIICFYMKLNPLFPIIKKIQLKKYCIFNLLLHTFQRSQREKLFFTLWVSSLCHKWNRSNGSNQQERAGTRSSCWKITQTYHTFRLPLYNQINFRSLRIKWVFLHGLSLWRITCTDGRRYLYGKYPPKKSVKFIHEFFYLYHWISQRFYFMKL